MPCLQQQHNNNVSEFSNRCLIFHITGIYFQINLQTSCIKSSQLSIEQFLVGNGLDQQPQNFSQYFSRIVDNIQSSCWNQHIEAKIRATINCPGVEELVHKKSTALCS